YWLAIRSGLVLLNLFCRAFICSGVSSAWGECISSNIACTNSRQVGKAIRTPGSCSALRLKPAPTMTAARDRGHCHKSFCNCLKCGRSGKFILELARFPRLFDGGNFGGSYCDLCNHKRDRILNHLFL